MSKTTTSISLLTAVSALLTMPLPGGAGTDPETVFAKSDPLWRPLNVPRASDVVMRSLRPRLDDGDHHSIDASRAFHVTRHEWTYLNYLAQGGSFEASTEFVGALRELGIMVGGAGSGSAHHVDRLTDKQEHEYCVLDIDGNIHVPPHKRGWDNAPGVGSVFSDEYLRIHAAHYMEQLDLGATSLQRDEAWMALSQGYDFSPHAIAAFRHYLKEHTDTRERQELGIRDLEAFNVADYFRALGPPEERPNRWFHPWQRDDPVKQHYARFIKVGTIAFYNNLREILNHHAGRKVPLSCNNTSLQQFTPVHLQFDWAMSELMFRTANPQHLYDRYREAIGHGKVQVLSTPKPIGEVEDYDAFRELNRQVIALAYSLGGLCKVPWDLFLQTVDGRGRYFGEPAHYADLYGFVRGMAPFLEGFEEAAAYGREIPDVHDWETHPVRITGCDDFYAFVRVRPRDKQSPVVIHVVNWGDADARGDLHLLASAIDWDPENSIVRLMRPAAYDERLHRLADIHQQLLRNHWRGGLSAGLVHRTAERDRTLLTGPQQYSAYQPLIDQKVLEPEETADGWVRLPGITAAPWSTIVIEKL